MLDYEPTDTLSATGAPVWLLLCMVLSRKIRIFIINFDSQPTEAFLPPLQVLTRLVAELLNK